jgi:hypothetical protein
VIFALSNDIRHGLWECVGLRGWRGQASALGAGRNSRKPSELLVL